MFPAFPAFDRYPVLVSVLLFHSRCPGVGRVVFLAACLAAMGGESSPVPRAFVLVLLHAGTSPAR